MVLGQELDRDITATGQNAGQKRRAAVPKAFSKSGMICIGD